MWSASAAVLFSNPFFIRPISGNPRPILLVMHALCAGIASGGIIPFLFLVGIFFAIRALSTADTGDSESRIFLRARYSKISNSKFQTNQNCRRAFRAVTTNTRRRDL